MISTVFFIFYLFHWYLSYFILFWLIILMISFVKLAHYLYLLKYYLLLRFKNFFIIHSTNAHPYYKVTTNCLTYWGYKSWFGVLFFPSVHILTLSLLSFDMYSSQIKLIILLSNIIDYRVNTFKKSYFYILATNSWKLRFLNVPIQ